MAVVFFQDLLHDGEPLRNGSPPKWIYRTDVIYERVEGSGGPQAQHTEAQLQATFREAQLVPRGTLLVLSERNRGRLQRGARAPAVCS